MPWDFPTLLKTAAEDIKAVSTPQELETFRLKYLGKKGLVPQIFSSLPEVPAQDKAAVGKGANDLRSLVSRLIEEGRQRVSAPVDSAVASFDISLPGITGEMGRRHVLTQTIEEICGIFEKLGFVVQEGPEIETEFHNFTALNIPVDHPSRDAFDTFYLESNDPTSKGRKLLLRSHTSPGQIRVMKTFKPPLAVIIPGRVYRPDAVDASHSFMFHQIEGLLV